MTKYQEWNNFRDVWGQGVGDDLLQVVEDQAALFHPGHNRAEVVV